MKYPITLTLIVMASIALIGCSKTYYVAPERYNYDANVTFTIDKIQVVARSQGYFFYKGFRELRVWVEVNNNSNETQFIDFDCFYLVNTKNNHVGYKVYQSMGQVVYTVGRMMPPIPGGSTKSRMLVFPYPEDEKPELLVANGISYYLHYTDTPPPSKTNNSNRSDQDL